MLTVAHARTAGARVSRSSVSLRIRTLRLRTVRGGSASRSDRTTSCRRGGTPGGSGGGTRRCQGHPCLVAARVPRSSHAVPSGAGPSLNQSLGTGGGTNWPPAGRTGARLSTGPRCRVSWSAHRGVSAPLIPRAVAAPSAVAVSKFAVSFHHCLPSALESVGRPCSRGHGSWSHVRLGSGRSPTGTGDRSERSGSV